MSKQSSQKTRKHDEIIVHDYDGEINALYKRIRSEFPKRTVKLIEKYDTEMINIPLAKATRRKHLQTVASLSRLVGKEWHLVTKEDIEKLVSRIMSEYSDFNGQESNSSYDNKKILKIFFRWFKLGSREFKEVGDPPETKRVKLRRVKDKIVRESLIDEKDLANMLSVCGENLRDRAFLDVHSEAGTRPSEIISLKIKHVKFDKYGAFIYVDGKTGSRPIRLVKSTPNLALWYDSHPYKDNPESPLWIMIDPKFYGKPMTYATASQMLYRICKRAGIKKRITLNLFRHSEATRSANFLTEAQMKKRHGWSNISKMPARYVHLVNQDVDDAIFKHLGIKQEDDTDKTLPKICHVCKMPNPYESSNCTKCGKALDIQTAIEQDEKTKEEKDELAKALDNLNNRLADLEKEKNQKIAENSQTQQRNEFLELLSDLQNGTNKKPFFIRRLKDGRYELKIGRDAIENKVNEDRKKSKK